MICDRCERQCFLSHNNNIDNVAHTIWGLIVNNDKGAVDNEKKANVYAQILMPFEHLQCCVLFYDGNEE